MVVDQWEARRGSPGKGHRSGRGRHAHLLCRPSRSASLGTKPKLPAPLPGTGAPTCGPTRLAISRQASTSKSLCFSRRAPSSGVWQTHLRILTPVPSCPYRETRPHSQPTLYTAPRPQVCSFHYVTLSLCPKAPQGPRQGGLHLHTPGTWPVWTLRCLLIVRATRIYSHSRKTADKRESESTAFQHEETSITPPTPPLHPHIPSPSDIIVGSSYKGHSTSFQFPSSFFLLKVFLENIPEAHWVYFSVVL